MHTLSHAVARVLRTLREAATITDKALVTSGDATMALDEAIALYADECPRELVADVVSTGGVFLALPTDADRIVSIEAPAGEDPPAYVDERAWMIYRTPADTKVRFAAALTAGTTVRLTHTTGHVLDNAGTTIPDLHWYAVCNLATSLACDAIAQRFARTTDTTVQADMVNYRSKAQEWGDRAKRYMTLYRNVVPVSGGAAAATGRFLNWDTRMSGGVDWLTHPRSHR